MQAAKSNTTDALSDLIWRMCHSTTLRYRDQTLSFIYTEAMRTYWIAEQCLPLIVEPLPDGILQRLLFDWTKRNLAGRKLAPLKGNEGTVKLMQLENDILEREVAELLLKTRPCTILQLPPSVLFDRVSKLFLRVFA